MDKGAQVVKFANMFYFSMLFTLFVIFSKIHSGRTFILTELKALVKRAPFLPLSFVPLFADVRGEKKSRRRRLHPSPKRERGRGREGGEGGISHSTAREKRRRRSTQSKWRKREREERERCPLPREKKGGFSPPLSPFCRGEGEKRDRETAGRKKFWALSLSLSARDP